MKKLLFITIGVLHLSFIGGFAQNAAKKDALQQLEEFKSKEKFGEDENLQYSRLSQPDLKRLLTENIDKAANDFVLLIKKGMASPKEYQNSIIKSLGRFNSVYAQLDTEDRERICSYFEELMDIVGLDSSDGALNRFMYGFDPTKNTITP